MGRTDKSFDKPVEIVLDEGIVQAVFDGRARRSHQTTSLHEQLGSMGSQAITAIYEPVAVACAAVFGLWVWLALVARSVVVSICQIGKVTMIGRDGRRTTLFVRQFDRPLGITVSGDRLVLATRHNLAVFANSLLLAHKYFGKPTAYQAVTKPDSLFGALTKQRDLGSTSRDAEHCWK